MNGNASRASARRKAESALLALFVVESAGMSYAQSGMLGAGQWSMADAVFILFTGLLLGRWLWGFFRAKRAHRGAA